MLYVVVVDFLVGCLVDGLLYESGCVWLVFVVVLWLVLVGVNSRS